MNRMILGPAMQEIAAQAWYQCWVEYLPNGLFGRELRPHTQIEIDYNGTLYRTIPESCTIINVDKERERKQS